MSISNRKVHEGPSRFQWNPSKVLLVSCLIVLLVFSSTLLCLVNERKSHPSDHESRPPGAGGSRQTDPPTIFLNETVIIVIQRTVSYGFSDLGRPAPMEYTWTAQRLSGPFSVTVNPTDFSMEIIAGDTSGNGSFILTARDRFNRTDTRTVPVQVKWNTQIIEDEAEMTPFLGILILIILVTIGVACVFLLLFYLMNRRISPEEQDAIDREKENRANPPQLPGPPVEQKITIPQSLGINTRYTVDKNHQRPPAMPPMGMNPYGNQQGQQQGQRAQPPRGQQASPNPLQSRPVQPSTQQQQSKQGHHQYHTQQGQPAQQTRNATQPQQVVSTQPAQQPRGGVIQPQRLAQDQSQPREAYEDPDKKELDMKLTICRNQVEKLRSSGIDVKKLDGLMNLAMNYSEAKNYTRGLKYVGQVEEEIVKLSR